MKGNLPKELPSEEMGKEPFHPDGMGQLPFKE